MMAVISMEARKINYRFDWWSEVPGTCPKVPKTVQMDTGNETATNETGTASVDCDDLCVDDYNCTEGMKCCNTGCRMECLKPVPEGTLLPLRLMKRFCVSLYSIPKVICLSSILTTVGNLLNSLLLSRTFLSNVQKKIFERGITFIVTSLYT